MSEAHPSAVPQEEQDARLLKLMEQWQDDALSLNAGQARSAEALPSEDDFQRGYRLGQRDRAESDAQALHLLWAASASSSTAPQKQDWQPIETAPRHQRCFFWVVPKSEHECPTNTSGRPITAVGHEPHRIEGEWGWWGSLWKPTHWMPLPDAPAPPTPSGRKK